MRVTFRVSHRRSWLLVLWYVTPGRPWWLLRPIITIETDI